MIQILPSFRDQMNKIQIYEICFIKINKTAKLTLTKRISKQNNVIHIYTLHKYF